MGPSACIREMTARFMVLLAVLWMAAAAANGQDAAGPDEIQREVYKEASRDYLDWQRHYLREAQRAKHQANRQIAFDKARFAEAEARKHAAQAGPVSEYEYWREQARIHKEYARNSPPGSAERKANQDYALSCEKQAGEKMAEAYRQAETDPAVRRDLSEHYEKEAEVRMREAQRYREMGETGKMSKAAAKALAEDAERKAAGSAEAASRYRRPVGTSKDPGGKKPSSFEKEKKEKQEKREKKNAEKKLKEKVKVLEKDIRNADNLLHQARKDILTKLGGLRAVEGTSSAAMAKRRAGLLAEYKNLGSAINDWKKDLRKGFKKAGGKGGNQQAAAREANKKLALDEVEKARECYDRAHSATTQTDKEIAWADAMKHERAALEYARKAGPAVEAECMQSLSRLLRREALREPNMSSGRGKACSDLSENYAKNSGKKLSEAHEKAKSDPATREDLSEYYRREGARNRAEAQHYRDRAARGDISQATADFLAGLAEQRATGCDESAERYSK